MKIRSLLIVVLALSFSTSAHALVTLVQTSDPGYYNNSIGTVLNGTNGGESGPFPVSNDSTLSFPTAPDLTAANSTLGNWLTDPGNLNSNWSFQNPIPNSWTPNHEVAVIYRFDTLGATNVVARFGVDNGIFAWLDGNYLFGARASGGVGIWEYTLNLGNLSAGNHYLQLLLEDHGSANGYAVNITADTFVPGPPPLPPATSASEPGAVAILGLGLAGLAFARRRKTT